MNPTPAVLVLWCSLHSWLYSPSALEDGLHEGFYPSFVNKQIELIKKEAVVQHRKY